MVTYCQTLEYVLVVMVIFIFIEGVSLHRKMLKFNELSWSHFIGFSGSMLSVSSVKETSQLKSEINKLFVH